MRRKFSGRIKININRFYASEEDISTPSYSEDMVFTISGIETKERLQTLEPKYLPDNGEGIGYTTKKWKLLSFNNIFGYSETTNQGYCCFNNSENTYEITYRFPDEFKSYDADTFIIKLMNAITEESESGTSYRREYYTYTLNKISSSPSESVYSTLETLGSAAEGDLNIAIKINKTYDTTPITFYMSKGLFEFFFSDYVDSVANGEEGESS